jgi:hypothetical protein
MDMCQRIVLDLLGGVSVDSAQLLKFRASLEDTLDRLKATY